MLAEVERAVRDHRPIVFLAWDPHPMNVRFKLRYLTGGDATFGPNFGGATIYTNTRVGYVQQCPNLGRLLRNLKFTTGEESEIMDRILDLKEPPEVAAATWMRLHPHELAAWLEGVHTLDGRPAAQALNPVARAVGGTALETWITDHKLPVGDRMALAIEFIKTHGVGFFNAISTVIGGAIDGLTRLLIYIPSLVLIAAITALTWLLRRSWALALFVAPRCCSSSTRAIGKRHSRPCRWWHSQPWSRPPSACPSASSRRTARAFTRRYGRCST